MTVNSVAWASAPATGIGSSAAVAVLLDRLGLGGLAGSDTTAPLGSNQSVTGTTAMTSAGRALRSLHAQGPVLVDPAPSPHPSPVWHAGCARPTTMPTTA
ncbi:hypothetical protein AB0A94_23125 [Streptomyces sp. NPDC044984]|uniref:hypothetical protein n=1 Tax=Streptomyces sp. NPDC044984 TaxID=3154335 RepID=UPI0033CB6FB5